MEKSRVAKALELVTQTRTAFTESKAPRYSEEYYSLLTNWDAAYKALNESARIQTAEVMPLM